MIERSHGKARPTLPRASDLHTTPAGSAPKPPDGRGPDGKFAAGNRLSVGARFTATIRKSLGAKGSTGAALVVAKDARRVFSHTLASLESDAAPVRALLSIYARHQALHAYYSTAAEALGLDTKEGLELLAVADRQSQRAERVLVTCHDLARVHAASEARRPGANGLPAGMIWYSEPDPAPEDTTVEDDTPTPVDPVDESDSTPDPEEDTSP